MNLYIKQKVFSWKDRFNVFDDAGNEVFYVEGEIFTLGKKLHLYRPDGTEEAFIHQKVFSFLPRYYISQNGTDIAEVVKKITFLKHEYTVDSFGWTVKGNFLTHDYCILKNDQTIATISKQWFTWGDAYQISTVYDSDAVPALCVVLIIDAVLAAQNAAAAASN